MMRVLDLFSGIGGFSLGLERTGRFRTVAFCEIDPYCRRVLAEHWPEVPCYDDVRTLTAERLAGDGIDVDAICGGFPCQDISFAGAGAGIDAARSGLWKHYARLIGEVRPRYVIVENVAALLVRGLEAVLGDLSALGYDAEWHCIPAASLGAPHRRDRVWIIAYADRKRSQRRSEFNNDRQRSALAESAYRNDDDGLHNDVSDADSAGLAVGQGESGYPRPKLTAIERADWWITEPDVGRVAHGVPARVDRLRSLGNAVVPQIPEMIGRAIMEFET